MESTLSSLLNPLVLCRGLEWQLEDEQRQRLGYANNLFVDAMSGNLTEHLEYETIAALDFL